MLKNFFIIIILFTSYPTFAEITISPSYSYYNTKNDFHNTKLEIKYQKERHFLFSSYSQMINLNDDYPALHSGYAGYTYFGKDFIVGGFAESSSDKLFGSIDVTRFAGFAGYNIYSKNLGEKTITTADGSTYQYNRTTNLYAGILLTEKPIFGTYILPFLAFNYEGEYLTFNLGIPNNSIIFRPSHRHTISYVNFMSFGNTFSYKFKPFTFNSIALSYEQEYKDYAINSEAISTSGFKKPRMTYYREWIKLKYQQYLTKNLELKLTFGYQIIGYYHHGKYFKKSPSNRLPHTNEYKIEIDYKF